MIMDLRNTPPKRRTNHKTETDYHKYKDDLREDFNYRCGYCDEPKLMLYNGLAFVNSDERKLMILKRIIESKIFWRYIQENAKPYASGYYSLSGVDIKHFGLPVLSKEQEDELLSFEEQDKVNNWLEKIYGLYD